MCRAPDFSARVTLLSLRCALDERAAGLARRMAAITKAAEHVVTSARLRRIIDVVLTIRGDDGAAAGAIGAAQALDVCAARRGYISSASADVNFVMLLRDRVTTRGRRRVARAAEDSRQHDHGAAGCSRGAVRERRGRVRRHGRLCPREVRAMRQHLWL